MEDLEPDTEEDQEFKPKDQLFKPEDACKDAPKQKDRKLCRPYYFRTPKKYADQESCKAVLKLQNYCE